MNNHRWVIGKEGSFIKQVEERSKAAVRISDSSIREYGREWKYVQLQGTPRAVDRAKSEWVGALAMWDDGRVCARMWMDGRLIGRTPRRVESCRRPFIHPSVLV